MLHFIPINMENGELQGMQLGADFHRDNYFISGITDFQNFNFQVASNPTNKQVTKSVKFGFDGESVSLAPLYEREITDRLRIFVQIQVKAQKGGANATSVSGGFMYGYRLKIFEELKL